jgi:hypothetical protein
MASAVDIKIVANTRQAQRGIKQLGGSFKKLDQQTRGLGTSLSSPLTMLAAGATAAAAAVAALSAAVIKNAIEVAALGDEIAKTARTTGVSAEQFQKYAFAAERGGVSQAKMTAGLKVLSRNLLEAQQGSDQMRLRFAAMNVQIQNADGSLRSTEQVLGDVANRVQTLGVSSQTTAELMQVMGRSGADLINVLIGGEAGLKAMGDEAERLGGIMSEELLAASEEYQDAITDLKFAFSGLRNELAEEVLPSLTKFAEELTTLLPTITEFAVPAVKELAAEFANLIPKPVLIAMALLGVQTRKMVEEPLETLRKVQEETAILEALMAGEMVGAKPPAPRAAPAAPARTAPRRGRAAAPAQDTGIVFAPVSPEDIQITKDGIEVFRNYREEQRRAYIESANARQVSSEAHERRMEQLREQLEMEEQVARAQTEAAAAAFGAIATFAGIAQQAVEDSYLSQTRAGKDAAKALFITAKLAAIAGATVNTALAITNALANVPAPANIAAAVGVGIAGAAEIGVIAATAIQGLADGGLAPGVLKKAGLNNHTVIGIRNDEAVIDPVGTKEITQMLSLQRRQMEMNVMGSANDSRPVVLEMDGRRLTRSLEPHLTRSVEDGSDFRQNVRFAGAL